MQTVQVNPCVTRSAIFYTKKCNKKNDLISNVDILPAMLKTATLGYDGKGQFKLNNIEDCKSISLSKNTDYILEKLVNLKN